MKSKASTSGRNGNLKIAAPFDEAVKAALEVKPPDKPPRRRRKPAKK